MSKKMSNKDNKNLESDQQNQKKIGQAESNPETSGQQRIYVKKLRK
jgi:hypothetical protein